MGITNLVDWYIGLRLLKQLFIRRKIIKNEG
jgi:hypothetical protein